MYSSDVKCRAPTIRFVLFFATAASLKGVTRISDKSSGTRPAETKGLTGENDVWDEDEVIVGVTLTLDVHTGGDVATTATEVERLGIDKDVKLTAS